MNVTALSDWISDTPERVPYIKRESGGGVDVGNQEYDTLVGGTLCWNQGGFSRTEPYTNNGVTYTFSDEGVHLEGVSGSSDSFINVQYTSGKRIVQQGHIYAVIGINPVENHIAMRLCYNAGSGTVVVSGSNRYYDNVLRANYPDTAVTTWFRMTAPRGNTINATITPQIYDLTLMFGVTIAEYVLSLETEKQGAGADWVKSFLGEHYYPYCAPELRSVSGVSAHVMRNSIGTLLGDYALDPSLTLRGIPKLDSKNKLYYDGDTYESDGTVTRKYAEVDLGTLDWRYITSLGEHPYFSVTNSNVFWGEMQGIVIAKYDDLGSIGGTAFASLSGTGYSRGVARNAQIFKIRDSSYTTVADFKAAMSGVMLVYELLEYTSETATPFESPQIVAVGGTEEYVTTGVVPVGHETYYAEVTPPEPKYIPFFWR
jgi:hypothetical protein